MLQHALRIRMGEGIYVPPSVEFIPYLYTPLYPTLLAMFAGSASGITYQLGRLFSILGLAGTAIVAIKSIADRRHLHVDPLPAYAGGVLAVGLYFAYYPYTDGWYDLVRADSLFLFMATAALGGLSRWTVTTTGWQRHAKVAAGAAVLALAFFTKQTGIFYVGIGGVVVLVLAWRCVPVFVLTAGAIGLGGSQMLQHTTDGWFWTYISEIHRTHDFNMDRFWKSFINILWHFPPATIVIGVTASIVIATWIRDRKFPRQAQPFLLWTSVFAVSVVVGAIGWGTEFAHFNAYMPAFLHGAMAAGACVPALAACGRSFMRGRPRRHAYWVSTAAALAAAIPLAVTLGYARWNPARFIPPPASMAAGDHLIDRIREIQGPVWIPAHPWYAVLAGKEAFVHRMGIKDVSMREPRPIEGLSEAIRDHAFAAIVVDRSLETGNELDDFPSLKPFYHPAFKLARDERPATVSGAKVVPDEIYMPATDSRPPPGAHVVCNFEAAQFSALRWKPTGQAWGDGPTDSSLTGQDFVLGVTGQRFATSMHGGDVAIGRLSSPPFAIDGSKLSFKLGGGVDETKLRVELRVDDQVVRAASVPKPGGDTLRQVTLDVSDLRGKQATLVFVDDSTLLGGHLDVDDVWIWQ